MKMLVGLTLLVFFHSVSASGQAPVADVGHKAMLKKQEKIKASFAKLKPMTRKIQDDSKFTLYEGIPRHGGSLEELGSEFNGKSIIKRFGHAFYSTANEVEAEDAKKLKTLVKAPQSFTKFRGYKLCGGFHPDFSLVFGTGNNAVELHVCFGCHELKAFRSGVEVYCDIPDGTYDELKKMLAKYQKQRPQPAAG